MHVLKKIIALLVCLGLFPALSHSATPAISAGRDHSMALMADGTVRAWGSDASGQLATGRQLTYPTPRRIEGFTGVRAISAGCVSTSALKNDGTVWSWGANDEGQLGDGSTAGSATPVQAAGVTGVSAISAGCFHVLALKSDGTVWAWGQNSYGQIGDGTNQGRSTPVQVLGLTDVVYVAAGDDHSTAIKRDGSVWRWGHPNTPIASGADQQASYEPGRIAGLTDVTAIACGYNTIFQKSDGSLVGVGPNQYGELGDGTTTPRPAPAPAGSSLRAAAIVAGAFSSIAIKPDGTLSAWGRNNDGQLGIGDIGPILVPGAVPNVTGVRTIAMSAWHAVAVKNDGSVWTWGSNSDGQLGDGTLIGGPTVRRVTGVANIVAVAAGSQHTAALASDGTVWAWGANGSGQAGVNVALFATTPAPVAGLSGIGAVAAGFSYSLALRSDGTLLAWGDNHYGQLGDGGASTSRTAPNAVSGISGVSAVAAGGFHAIALKGDGSVWAWGNNFSGQIGDGTKIGRSIPTRVAGLSDIVAVAAGQNSSMALKRDGTVWSWGTNNDGQLGVAPTDCNPSFSSGCNPLPTQVPISGVVAIAAGRDHSLVLKSDGTVWGFGLSSDGALGELDNPNHTPRQVPGLTDIIAIQAAERYTLALKRDGTVWALGFNYWGQLGDGTSARAWRFPVQAKGVANIVAISAQARHSMALKADGTLWTWGRNEFGTLGDGTLAWRFAPVVAHREGGAGALASNDWFLDTNPAGSKTIPADKIPVFLVVASGSGAAVSANVRFRPQDVGKPIYLFAYAPASQVKRGVALKDGATCVLAQLGSDGQLQQVSASNVQSTLGNVTSSQGQAVSVLNNLSAAQLAGATFCVASASSASQAVDAANNHCVATVPAEQVCVSEGDSALANAPGPLSGMWWNAGESGWGIHFTQRRNTVFAAWYTYDGAGNPKWYVASNCTMPDAGGTSGACNAPLYEVSGPAFFGAAFNPAAVNVATAGSLQLNFQSQYNASMTYSAAGQTRTVPITRQVFQTSGGTPFVDYTDLWWNSSESGWGLAVTQQFGIVFLAWYVYDSAGKPVWYVVPSCTLNAAQTSCSGDIYRTTGPAFGPAFNPAQVQAFVAGTASVTFSDASNGVLNYTVNGVSASKVITRQLF